jgi:hypothetical protein
VCWYVVVATLNDLATTAQTMSHGRLERQSVIEPTSRSAPVGEPEGDPAAQSGVLRIPGDGWLSQG